MTITPDCFKGKTTFPQRPDRRRGADDVSWMTWDMLQWFANSVFDPFATCIEATMVECCNAIAPTGPRFAEVMYNLGATHNLLGWWRLGDAGSPFLDSNPFLPPVPMLITAGGTAMTPHVTGGLGPDQDDGAARFNGISNTTADFLTATPSDSRWNTINNTTGGHYSVSCWVKPTTQAIDSWGGQIIGDSSAGLGNEQGWWLGLGQTSGSPTSTLSWIRRGDFQSSGTGVLVNIPNDVWSFVVATSDDATMKIYVNGVLAASGALTSAGTGIAPGGNILAVGRYVTSSPAGGTGFWYLHAAVDELAIWRSTLAASDVLALFNSADPTLPISTADHIYYLNGV